MNPWNLTPDEWSMVLLKKTPERAAEDVISGNLPAWDEYLLHYTKDSKEVLDLGCGAGLDSANLARRGIKTTLLDLSKKNLDFCANLFRLLKLNGEFRLADMTQPLPFEDGSFDTVFSIGVFEYFTDEQIQSILREAFRVSRKRVIIMVPNALSLPYRLGYWYLKETKQWIWGGERPFRTLKPYFKSEANSTFFEFTIAARTSLSFLTMPYNGLIKRIVLYVLRLEDDSRVSLFRQGYLLISIGEKNELTSKAK